MELDKSFLQMVITNFLSGKAGVCNTILNLPHIFNCKRLYLLEKYQTRSDRIFGICLLYVLTLADVLKYLAEKKIV